MKYNLKPNQNGWLEGIIQPVPESWPWALPYLYGINIAPNPTPELVGAKATLDGKYNESKKLKKNKTRFEVIGYWNNEIRIMEINQYSNHEEAKNDSERIFELGKVKYLLEKGIIYKENKSLLLTGNWPDQWEFKTVQDFGVFCAFVYEYLKPKNLGVADEFKKAMMPETTQTEQLVLFIRELEHILENKELIEDRMKLKINSAIRIGKSWL
jgi:hypothetical protein